MRRAAYLLLAAIVIAVPTVVASIVLWHFNQATVFDTLPVQSDEMFYWHEAATFATVGFDSGYYAASDALPRVGRFYAWGAVAPVMYGVFAAVFGWPLWAITVLNLAFLALATAALIWLARLNFEQLLWLGALLTTFHPLLIYSPTQYLEVLNFAFALLLAGLFVRLIRAYQDDQPSHRALWLAAGGVILFAALIRFTWAFLYVPLLILVVRPTTLRAWITMLAQSAVLMAIPTGVFALTSARTVVSRLERNPTLERAFRIVGNRIAYNLRVFMDGDPLELDVRVGSAVIVAVLTAGIAVFLIWKLRGRTVPTLIRRGAAEGIVAWSVLGGLLAFIVVIYDIHGLRGYRMLSSVLLMLIVLAVALRRRWLLAPLLVYQIIVFPYALYFYDNFTNFQTSPEKLARYEEYKPQLAEVLTYDPDALSPWCNTVMYDLYYLLGETSVFIAAPYGFGLSITEIVPEGEMPAAPKSKYIALRDGNYESYRPALNLEPLLPLPDGMLYLNLDAPCTP